MTKPFTKMLAELNIYMGNKLISPTSSSEIDALSDKEDDKVGGMELPSAPEVDPELPSEDEITDLNDTDTDLSKLTLDQIIAALQGLKAKEDGEKDIGGQRIEPHSDFADVDPTAPPEFAHPADTRMPDDGPVDDDGIPALPGMRKSPEDEQLASAPKSANPFDDEDTTTELEKKPEADSDDPFGDTDPEPDPEGNPEAEGEADPFADPATAAPEEVDPNRMGTIRAVAGAHLVHKRQAGDGTFSELWMYNIGDHINNAISIKKAIIAGTDIPENKLRSDDGSQSYELVTLGNAQMIKVSGLPN